MTIGSADPLKDEKPRKLKLVLVFAAIACAGVFYIGRQSLDWQQPASPAQNALAPAPEPPLLASPLAPSFDAVSADESGMLVAAGKGPAGATVLLKSGEQTIGETKADGNGEWVMILETPLAGGDHALSLQAIDPETHKSVPGRRTYALKVAPHTKTAIHTQMASTAPIEAGQAAQASVAVKPTIAVKRGDTLWDIARRHFGDASRYSEIVNANKPQIKNPDLIYPDQQFEMPHK